MAARRYSSYYKNPYGRTYRRPSTFKTLFKHMIQDSVDTAVYNAFDSPQVSYKKELEKAQSAKAKYDSDFLNSVIDLPKTDISRVVISVNKSNYLNKAEEIIKKFQEVTVFKLSTQKKLVDYKRRLEDINTKKVGENRASNNPIFFVALLGGLLACVFLFSFITIVISVIAVIAAIGIMSSNEEKKANIQLNEKRNHVETVGNQIDSFDLYIDFDVENDVINNFNILKNGFEKAASSEKIWDILSYSLVADEDYSKIDRRKISFDNINPSDILSNFESLHLSNIDGADLYLFPLFVLAFDEKEISFLDYRDLELTHELIELIETEYNPPKDGEVLGNRWERQNKDGSANKRFKDNRLVPIIKYSRFDIKDNVELDETYLVSNWQKGLEFTNSFQKYTDFLKTKLPN